MVDVDVSRKITDMSFNDMWLGALNLYIDR